MAGIYAAKAGIPAAGGSEDAAAAPAAAAAAAPGGPGIPDGAGGGGGGGGAESFAFEHFDDRSLATGGGAISPPPPAAAAAAAPPAAAAAATAAPARPAGGGPTGIGSDDFVSAAAPASSSSATSTAPASASSAAASASASAAPPPPLGAFDAEDGSAQRRADVGWRFWRVEFFQFLFDVTTADVAARLAAAALPVRKPRLLLQIHHANRGAAAAAASASASASAASSASAGGVAAAMFGAAPGAGGAGDDDAEDADLLATADELTDAERDGLGADLYGPFWIATTLVALLPAVGNISNFMDAVWAQSSAPWRYNFEQMGMAASLIYGYLVFLPLMVFFGARWLKGRLRLFDIACVYGYSLFALVPAALVAIVPSNWVRIAVFLLAGLSSAVYLVRSFYSVLTAHRFKPMLLALGGVQLALAATCGILFFVINPGKPVTLEEATTPAPTTPSA